MPLQKKFAMFAQFCRQLGSEDAAVAEGAQAALAALAAGARRGAAHYNGILFGFPQP